MRGSDAAGPRNIPRWYRTEFTPPPGFLGNLRQQIVFEGIDFYGQIFVNGTLKSYAAVVRYGWIRLDGTARALQEKRVIIPADGMMEVAGLPLPSRTERDPREWIYAALLNGKGFPDDQATWLLAPQRELVLAKPVLSTKVRADGILEVASTVYCHAVHLDDGGDQTLDDNYFDLLPGVPRRIRVTKPAPSGEYPLAAVLPITER
jgi:hypothetical protein